MNKKIAQLTNVIHHLHTKTEDHEMDLQEMAAAYESEIESMLKDAATRINSFKNQLEAARDDARFQEAVQKVKAEHEQLRQVSQLTKPMNDSINEICRRHLQLTYLVLWIRT